MKSHRNPTFVFFTFGCKVNQYETQAMREALLKNGFTESPCITGADFCIVNSCTVTHKADRDVRNAVRRFYSVNPKGSVIVAGCYAEMEEDRKILEALPGVKHFIRNKEKKLIGEIASRAFGALAMTSGNGALPPSPRLRRTGAMTSGISDFIGHDRAFVKAQDGCDHKCSYCKVSIVRGPSISRDAEDIIKEKKFLIEKGFSEVVLTGVCLGAWGRDFKNKLTLTTLVDEVASLTGKFRIRLSSVEPVYVTSELITIVRDNDKICKHFHIPLQSGDDKILKLMKRQYSSDKFLRLVENIRSGIPDAGITTDVLVGFPGEDENSFRKTLKTVNKIIPSRMHIFSYSERPKTEAAKARPLTGADIKKKRVKELEALNREFSMDFAERFLGSSQDVLIETQRDKATGFLQGYTANYVRVLLDAPEPPGKGVRPVEITKVDRRQNLVLGCLDNANII